MTTKLLHIQVDILKLAVEHPEGAKLSTNDGPTTAFAWLETPLADLIARGLMAEMDGFACITESGKIALAERLAQDGNAGLRDD